MIFFEIENNKFELAEKRIEKGIENALKKSTNALSFLVIEKISAQVNRKSWQYLNHFSSFKRKGGHISFYFEKHRGKRLRRKRIKINFLGEIELQFEPQFEKYLKRVNL